MGKNGESGGLPLFETYGKKKNKKRVCLLVYICVPGFGVLYTQNTPLDDTTCGYQKRRGEEDGERKKKTDIVFFDRAFCWGASTTREPLSLSLSIYIY